MNLIIGGVWTIYFINIAVIWNICMHFYYRITNKLNGKVYIGETDNPDRRWTAHKNSSKSQNPELFINKMMKKEGILNFEFEIISCSKDGKYKYEIERILISQYDSANLEKGYNISTGAGNGMSDSTRKKMSEAQKGNKNHMFGKHHTEEAKLKVSKANTGLKRTEEVKLKMSISMMKYPPNIREEIIFDRLNGMTISNIRLKYNIARRTLYDIIKGIKPLGKNE